MTLQLIDKGKIYFYLALLLILLSLHNTNQIKYLNNFFKISKIELIGNIDENLHQEILSSLKKFYNYNIFYLSSNEITNTLDSYNILNKYKIKKEYPSVIKVELEKTKILAYYFQNNQPIFIGDNGKKITNQKIKIDNFPLIVGNVDIEKFLKLRLILLNSEFKLSDFNKFYSFKSNRWDIVYKNKILLKLPDKQLEKSISLFKKILDNKNIQDIKIIDLRLINKIILS
tara:strand:+ start:13506 stop:14192 length:687 start_codon:yes stop_codon:yes gene_type:complete